MFNSVDGRKCDVKTLHRESAAGVSGQGDALSAFRASDDESGVSPL